MPSGPFRVATFLGAALAAFSAGSATAATATFNLSAVDASAGLPAGPYGSITVTENPNGSLSFVENLAISGDFRIHDGNANHNALAFSLIGNPAITISGLTAGFQAIGAVTAPPFGAFSYGIDCLSACGPGFGGGFTGSLSFNVLAAAPLSIASLQFNIVDGQQIYFASDLVARNGNTANVGATFSASPVPGPVLGAGLPGLVMAFGGLIAWRRRKQQTAEPN